MGVGWPGEGEEVGVIDLGLGIEAGCAVDPVGEASGGLAGDLTVEQGQGLGSDRRDLAPGATGVGVGAVERLEEGVAEVPSGEDVEAPPVRGPPRGRGTPARGLLSPCC